MAKNPKRRGRRRYLRGSVDESIAFAVLAAKDVAVEPFDETVNERTLISSLVAAYSLSNFSVTSGVGPILVGVAHSDYASAEIEAYIESSGSWDEGDLVQQEIAKRRIRRIGIFDASDLATEDATLNDGKPIKTKLNWILNQGQGLQLWTYNLGTAAVVTTIPVVHAEGHANLWPTG